METYSTIEVFIHEAAGHWRFRVFAPDVAQVSIEYQEYDEHLHMWKTLETPIVFDHNMVDEIISAIHAVKNYELNG